MGQDPLTSALRFGDCWRSLGCRGDGRAIHAQLLAAWQEPHRAYHDLSHLRACLTLLDEFRALAEDPAAVALALWFHDAVYRPGHRGNERRSARWARRALSEGGATADCVSRIEGLVLATRHVGQPAGDAALTADIDLAILGAPAAEYDAYEAAVRSEWWWLPAPLWRSGRRRLLDAFLRRPVLFHTPALRARFEERARENLGRAGAW